MDTRSRNQYFNDATISTYTKEYGAAISSALSTINLKPELDLLWQIKNSGGRIFVAGNGGSASISDHLACDFEKGAQIHTLSLVGRMALFTAIANDIGYSAVFTEQLEAAQLSAKDVVILISSSGNSPNVLLAAGYAIAVGATVIGLTGFDGGELKKRADYSIHIPVNNYGVIEDCHQAVMHILAQYFYLQQHKDPEHEKKYRETGI